MLLSCISHDILGSRAYFSCIAVCVALDFLTWTRIMHDFLLVPCFGSEYTVSVYALADRMCVIDYHESMLAMRLIAYLL